jgi:malonyl CoA-acyl carrier protein transacylase
MNQIAWLFPGHGAQYVGMGCRLMEQYPEKRIWFQRAEEISGRHLTVILERGPVTRLLQPQILEPLLAAVSCAWVDVVRESGRFATVLAGYSAGELPALYAAGVLDADAVMVAACFRGKALEQAATEMPGRMLAVAGVSVPQGQAILADAGLQVWLAAMHAPRHFTVSGGHSDIAAIAKHLRNAGASVEYLDIAGPWHSPLAAAASEQLHADLATLPTHMPHTEVYLGSTGRPCNDAALLVRSLADSVVLPVQWQSLIENVVARGIRQFLELGPGGTLFGLLGQLGQTMLLTRQFAERRGSKRSLFSMQSTMQSVSNV